MADEEKTAALTTTAEKVANALKENKGDLADGVADVMDILGPYLKSIGEAAERPLLHRIKPEVALQLLGLRKEQALMEKEVALRQLDIEGQRILAEARGQSHLLIFSSFALIIFTLIILGLVKLSRMDVAIGVIIALTVFVSVLLDRKMQQFLTVSTIRELLRLRGDKDRPQIPPVRGGDS